MQIPTRQAFEFLEQPPLTPSMVSADENLTVPNHRARHRDVIRQACSTESAPAWSTVQPQIAKWTSGCSYDRAGAGFAQSL
jgi:hypothetical protein